MLELLGEGGFSLTYHALDLDSRPKVIKVLTNNHPKYVELFQQEAHVMEKMSHPGIPKIDLDGYFTYLPKDGEEPMHCIAMEKIEGLNLEEYLKKRGNRPIEQKRLLRWLAELSLILERVHNLDFFHRDIKPSNIMLRPNGSLVLIDFGTVRQLSKSYIDKQAAGLLTGVISSGYTPMEQIKGKAVKQSDFYALGGTMIFLLTGRNPLEFYDSQTGKMKWHDDIENISPPFVNLIERMMAHLPGERPKTAREIFREIIQIDSSLIILEDWLQPPTSSSFQANSTSNHTFVVPNRSPTNRAASGRTERNLSPEFVHQCRRELAEFIGPIATIICDQTLAHNPYLSNSEFIRALAERIPDSQISQQFQQKLL
ncbi:MAG: serine/threonine-protein kinase [Xenococcaceae cyanobacterium MO_234.B1]|nr:serine/threonine-protein kinase [Xenococcaceae cyanobacterium MO_234.B1]